MIFYSPLSNMLYFLVVKLSSLYFEILSQENAPIFNLKRIKKCFLQGKCLFFPLAFLAQQLLRWALTHLGGNPSLQSGLTSRFFLSDHYKHQMAQWNIWVIFILSKYGHNYLYITLSYILFTSGQPLSLKKHFPLPYL